MNEKHAEAIRARGELDGTAAASWFFDGNTAPEAYAHVYAGIQDGDPEVMDRLPSPDWSGQWDTGLDFNDVVNDEIGEDEMGEYIQMEETGDGESGPSVTVWYDLDELIDVYDAAYQQAAHHEIERVCILQLTEGYVYDGQCWQYIVGQNAGECDKLLVRGILETEWREVPEEEDCPVAVSEHFHGPPMSS